MPCYGPLLAYYGEKNPSGKRSLTFRRKGSFSGIGFEVPCGQCVGCRLEKSRQWAMRCYHEYQMHECGCFITLTYDPEHLPEHGTLVKKHFQDFMKRLRKRFGNGIRFFACGEYGDRTWRPHYHAILFGVQFSDRKFLRRTKAGFDLYFSRELEKLWTYGQNTIGDVSFDTAAYCARYVMKKMSGPAHDVFYLWTDPDGVVHERIPEFALMSRRPGIGSTWFEKFGGHAMALDRVIMNNREVRPPRFYDTRFEVIDSAKMAMLRSKRRRAAARIARSERGTRRRRVSEVVAEARLGLKRREL